MLQTFYFENARSCPSIVIVSPWRNLWYPKCWNQLVRNFDIYLHARSQIYLELLRSCKDIKKLAILGTLGILDHLHQNRSNNLKQAFMLICMQKVNCITHFFLKILQRKANILFWVIWACLAIHTWNGSITLKKPSAFISRQKLNFIFHVFLDIFTAKILQTPCFGYFEHVWLRTP